MKDLVILLLVSVALFLVWNGRRTTGYDPAADATTGPSDAPVPPSITQAILVKVQQAAKTIWPLETLYIKKSGQNTYDARFMFFNTDGYYGTQYDVKANVDGGSVQIVSQTATAIEGDAQNPGYVPDTYQNYDVIEKSLDDQLRAALKNSKSYEVWNPTRQTVMAPGPVIGPALTPKS